MSREPQASKMASVKRWLPLPLVLVLTLVSLAFAPAADAAAVAIFDDALRPSRITIAPGESVTWINGGTSPHTVKSDRRVWRTFTVQPAATSRAVRFRRAGLYRYRVDGRLRGVIVVSRRLGPGGGGSGGGGGGSGNDGGSRRVFRYSLTANGETRWKRYYPNDPGAGGRIVNKRWTMAFRDFRVVVHRFPGVPVSLGIPGNSARGSVNTYYQYTDDERFTPNDHRPICDIGGNYPNMAATLSLYGFAARRGVPGEIALRADHAQGDVIGQLSREAANFACPEREPGSPLTHGVDLGPILVRGATLNGHGNPSNVQLTRRWSSPAIKSPLDDLISGRRFIHFETGLRTQLLVNNQPSAVPTCPDPDEPCVVDEVGKRLEITLRRR